MDRKGEATLPSEPTREMLAALRAQNEAEQARIARLNPEVKPRLHKQAGTGARVGRGSTLPSNRERLNGEESSGGADTLVSSSRNESEQARKMARLAELAHPTPAQIGQRLPQAEGVPLDTQYERQAVSGIVGRTPTTRVVEVVRVRDGQTITIKARSNRAERRYDARHSMSGAYAPRHGPVFVYCVSCRVLPIAERRVIRDAGTCWSCRMLRLQGKALHRFDAKADVLARQREALREKRRRATARKRHRAAWEAHDDYQEDD